MKMKILRAVLLALALCLLLGGCESQKHTPYQGSGGGAAPVFKNEGSTSGTETAQKPNSGKYTARVALTFDDGPHSTRTKRIVDELEKYGYHATFFVVGNRVDGSEYNGTEAMKYAYSKGNEIAVHAYTHEYYYDSCSDSEYKNELSKTEAAIKAQIPKANVRLMRPVGGQITDNRVSTCKYAVIQWSVDSYDWNYTKRGDDAEQKKNVDIIVENVMSKVKDGAIILMHDIHENTAVAVPIILNQLHEQGYDVVTVSELLGSSMKTGEKYPK